MVKVFQWNTGTFFCSQMQKVYFEVDCSFASSVDIGAVHLFLRLTQATTPLDHSYLDPYFQFFGSKNVVFEQNDFVGGYGFLISNKNFVLKNEAGWTLL